MAAMCWRRSASLLTLLLGLMVAQQAQGRALQAERDAAAVGGAAAPEPASWWQSDASTPTPAPAPAPAPMPAGMEDELSPSPSPEESPSPSPEESPSPSPEESSSPSPSPSPSPEEEPRPRKAGQPTYTVGSAPSAPGFDPKPVPAQYRGTCELKGQEESTARCDDDMGDLGDSTSPEDFRLLQDPGAAVQCIVPNLDDIVNGLVGDAYSGRFGTCGITAYTISRACAGQGDKSNNWRVRVMLWPDSDDCEPLCMKMRGEGGDVTDYGRTATC